MLFYTTSLFGLIMKLQDKPLKFKNLSFNKSILSGHIWQFFSISDFPEDVL